AGIRPLAGPLSPTVASSLARQRRLLARSLVLVTLTACFAASTATFNATYRQQAAVDARLTNGADVTVVEPPGATVGPDAAAQLRRTRQLRNVAFHYAGVVKEFPTAPRDSFIVANADYVARATGSDAVGSFLLDTSGGGGAGVAARVRAVVGTQAKVSDLST